MYFEQESERTKKGIPVTFSLSLSLVALRERLSLAETAGEPPRQRQVGCKNRPQEPPRENEGTGHSFSGLMRRYSENARARARETNSLVNPRARARMHETRIDKNRDTDLIGLETARKETMTKRSRLARRATIVLSRSNCARARVRGRAVQPFPSAVGHHIPSSPCLFLLD